MKRVAVPSRVPTLIDPFELERPRTPMHTLVDAFEIQDEVLSDEDILEVIDFDDRVLESGVRAVGERVEWAEEGTGRRSLTRARHAVDGVARRQKSG